MQKKYGYTIPELLIVVGILGLIALVSITKISYAFDTISNEEEKKEEIKNMVELASISYAKTKSEDFKSEKEVYIYAKEVAQAGYLFEKDEYNSMKIKITFDESKNAFQAEVVE